MSNIPVIPGLPILTEERIMTAVLHFMAEERSIEEVAAIEKQSSSSVRMDVHKPILCEAFYKVGERNGYDIVKTTFRQRWYSQDQAGKLHGAEVERKREARRGSRGRRRAA